MFTTIIITRPAFFDEEAALISQYLQQGTAGLVHIRKPGADAAQVEHLLQAIAPTLRHRLVLHDCHHLAERYCVYGVHLNGRNPLPPDGWQGSVSRSCHSLEEVIEWKKHCNYVSLSPIFDSVSKQGYLSAFSNEDIAQAVRHGIIDEKVYALGGITFAKLPEVKTMGFGGAMILGDAWKQ